MFHVVFVYRFDDIVEMSGDVVCWFLAGGMRVGVSEFSMM